MNRTAKLLLLALLPAGGLLAGGYVGLRVVLIEFTLRNWRARASFLNEMLMNGKKYEHQLKESSISDLILIYRISKSMLGSYMLDPHFLNRYLEARRRGIFRRLRGNDAKADPIIEPTLDPLFAQALKKLEGKEEEKITKPT